jgi:hypothetical protein
LAAKVPRGARLLPSAPLPHVFDVDLAFQVEKLVHLDNAVNERIPLARKFPFQQYRSNIDSRQALKAQCLIQKMAPDDSILARRGHVTCEVGLDR